MSLLLSLVTPPEVTASSPHLVQVIVTTSPLVGGWLLLPAACGQVTATRCLWTGHCSPLLVNWVTAPCCLWTGHCALLVDWSLLPTACRLVTAPCLWTDHCSPTACGLVTAPCLWTGHCSPLLVDWSLHPACGLVTAPRWSWTGHCSPLLVDWSLLPIDCGLVTAPYL